MNSQQSLVEKEIQELIQVGDELVRQAAGAPSWLHGEPVTQMAMWASRGGQLIQRQVSTWGVLRNSAAHNYAGYDETQVAQMLQSVQKFAADYLAYIRRPNAPVPADPPPKAAVGG